MQNLGFILCPMMYSLLLCTLPASRAYDGRSPFAAAVQPRMYRFSSSQKFSDRFPGIPY